MISSTVEMVAQTMTENRAKFEAFCRSLSDEELERPVPDSEWRVKDFIIHLCELDAQIAQSMDGIKAGDLASSLKTPDGSKFELDAYNNARVAERREWPLERILAAGAETRARLLEAMATMSDEHINQVVPIPGDNKRPSGDVQYKVFLFGLARHDPVHVADMVKALPEKAADPEVMAWLDDPAVNWYQRVMAGPATT